MTLTVPVKWYNDDTLKWDVYEAFIHFLGTSETDVETQVQKAEESGTRLKLPSQKVLESLLSEEEVPISNDEAKVRKAKMDLAKSKLREDILQKKDELLMADRDPLHLTDESDKENDVAAENGEDENSDLTAGNTGTVMAVTKKTTQSLKSNIQTYDNAEQEIQSLEAQRTVEKNKQDRDEVLIGKDPFAQIEGNYKDDTHNEQTYLGAGMFIDIADWISIKAIKEHGPFIIQLATEIWGNELADMCLDLKKAKSRHEGQIRKQFRKKQLKALEEIFLEKLRSQGYRGNRKLQKMVKKVRTTLTHKINDLNKAKSEKDEQGETSGSEF